MEFFTIGHSNHSFDDFLSLLQLHGVTAIADVRSIPYSRYTPQFNQALLQYELRQAGVAYVFLGDELGARSRDRSCYVNGTALYEKIAATPSFQTGIDRLHKGTERYRIALMCAEADPVTCHRAILISPQLQASGATINHILKAGALEPQSQIEARLLKLHHLEFEGTQAKSPDSGLDQLNLFSENLGVEHHESTLTRAEAIREAYRLQGMKIAYVERKAVSLEHDQLN